MADISQNIKRLRIRKQMSQAQLAEKIGVTRQTVSSWERGLSFPDIQMVEKMSQVFETEIGGLLYPTEKAKIWDIKPFSFRFVLLSVLLYAYLLLRHGIYVARWLGEGVEGMILWGLILLVGYIAICIYVISNLLAETCEKTVA